MRAPRCENKEEANHAKYNKCLLVHHASVIGVEVNIIERLKVVVMNVFAFGSEFLHISGQYSFNFLRVNPGTKPAECHN